MPPVAVPDGAAIAATNRGERRVVARKRSGIVASDNAAGVLEETAATPKRSQSNGSRRQKMGLLDRIREGASLEGTDLRFLWFVHWDLSGRDLRSANLRGTQLTGSDLSSCDLRGAVLEAANLIGACLRDAQLDNANLEGALVHGADFRGVTGLTKAARAALQARGAIVSDGVARADL
jgi:uncharacterized protein YjbI with pentapeptide repeats